MTKQEMLDLFRKLDEKARSNGVEDEFELPLFDIMDKTGRDSEIVSINDTYKLAQEMSA